MKTNTSHDPHRPAGRRRVESERSRPTGLLASKCPRATSFFGIVMALASCDDGSKPGPVPSAAPTTEPPSASTTAAPKPTVSARPMPPRPYPVGSSGPVKISDPPEKQMMAINYTLAMVAPRPGDAGVVDDAYVERMLGKLKGLAMSAGGAGLSKGKEPARAAKGDRKFEVDVAKCTERAPGDMLRSAGSSYKEAVEAGVLVISCRDKRIECHQSTRDPDDVLCHAAPRR